MKSSMPEETLVARENNREHYKNQSSDIRWRICRRLSKVTSDQFHVDDAIGECHICQTKIVYDRSVYRPGLTLLCYPCVFSLYLQQRPEMRHLMLSVDPTKLNDEELMQKMEAGIVENTKYNAIEKRRAPAPAKLAPGVDPGRSQIASLFRRRK